MRAHRRRGAGNDPGVRRDGAGQEVQAAGEAGRDAQRLPRSERRQPGAVERPGRSRDGRLAAGGICRGAVQRPVQGLGESVRGYNKDYEV